MKVRVCMKIFLGESLTPHTYPIKHIYNAYFLIEGLLSHRININARYEFSLIIRTKVRVTSLRRTIKNSKTLDSHSAPTIEKRELLHKSRGIRLYCGATQGGICERSRHDRGRLSLDNRKAGVVSCGVVARVSQKFQVTHAQETKPAILTGLEKYLTADSSKALAHIQPNGSWLILAWIPLRSSSCIPNISLRFLALLTSASR